MGILNVTPDSFSDGGRFFDRTMAIDQALAMVSAGADIIDIGGESTRPGAEAVSYDEELRRTIPVIEAIAQGVSIPISIDTYKAAVARRALEAGAEIINDISGLRFDGAMASVAAHYDAAVIIMHIKGTPKDMQINPVYEDIFSEIGAYFNKSIDIALAAGVKKDMIVLDPGIGFGKTIDHNLQIIGNLGRFKGLGYPILIGASRKAFIGKILGDVPVDKRLMGTAAMVSASILKGADIVRVHDVREMSEVARAAFALRGAAQPLR
ncbi:dihydropteroate synthase [Candidatus Magnetominusculus xianensis]|uniref:dihydropteroate synthase n=1 Tax=Candidatus Magnetominusculus xianensis TaxID=1748249 RepID=A0ABR5SMJ6_9BACT|nr:dihydropteroate synthase [Candidatus Magnetominusculus xianensis]KWT92836.1 dihydropteroate synthase [Candidatus Magnetominusculus xianensis]MBF0403425.1 dihydropteroate synthase [Nitrospirota bacterium]